MKKLLIIILVLVLILICIYYANTPEKCITYRGPAIVTCKKLGDKGQLGNQFFQLAAILSAALTNKCKVVLPTGVTSAQIWKIIDLNKFHRADYCSTLVVIEKSEGIYNELELKTTSDAVNDVEGYFQSYKYFQNHEDEIKAAFTLKQSIITKALDLIPSCSHPNSIGIHVRRGDYLVVPHSSRFTLCNVKYYTAALSYILNQLRESPPIIVCSDDIEWCKSNLNIENAIYSESKDWSVDFAILNQCQHHIIANSSFSWWASWLSSKTDNYVIAPYPWYKFGSDYESKNSFDMYPPTWTVLDAADGTPMPLIENYQRPVEKATIVSAYYVINSKRPSQQYTEWIKNFMQIRCRIIMYVGDDNTKSLIESMRSPSIEEDDPWCTLQIIVVPITDFIIRRRYGDEFWANQYSLDPEKVIHKGFELYLVWNEKINFVTSTIAMDEHNSIKSDYYLWVDAGCWRDKNLLYKYTTGWPNVATLSLTDKMTLLEVNPLNRKFCSLTPETYSNSLIDTDCIAAGVFGGKTFAWQPWSDAFYSILDRLASKGVFIGKEQSIYTLTAITYPNLVNIVKPRGDGNKWFFLQEYYSSTAAFTEQKEEKLC